MSNPKFQDLAVSEPLLRALEEEGYTHPTPIQQEGIPLVLAGRDLLATAQTGTGKTAAFALPILQMLGEKIPHTKKPIRSLILTPTRELAIQIDESLKAYGRHLRLKTAVVLGGVSAEPQIKALRRQPDILVATPGRLLDLHNQGYIPLDRVEILVLDEADRMLDMGFIKDVRRIVNLLPKKRQTLFFSATLGPVVARLASDMLRDPATVVIAPPATVAGNIAQKVMFVQHMHKRELLAEVLRGVDVSRALVFTRTKHRANRVSKQLTQDGIRADAIHSNKSQGARQRALSDFDRGRIKVLVGTDVVARGIDVDGISHVINYEMPEDPESYVHRIGRTARAGANGIALSFCAAEEVMRLRDIEKLTHELLVPVEDHRYHCSATAALNGRTAARAEAQANAAPANRPKFGRNAHKRGQNNGRRFR